MTRAMLFVICLAAVLHPEHAQAHVADSESADVVIYGGTSAGVIAAVQVSRMGRTAILIEPTAHLGGLTSGGLGFTDNGDKRVIGGLAREFYRRVRTHYDDPASWTLQPRESYAGYRAGEDAMWTFEPHVAETILRGMLAETSVVVVAGERLDRVAGVRLANGAIAEIRMESGRSFVASQFIDATYEGDLMASAGVRYTVGRESNSDYGETLNGNQVAANTHNHRFLKQVSPFVVAGDASSGLLPGIESSGPGIDGTGDHRVQAFCFRMCMSNVPENMLPFPKPDDYDEQRYELLLRNFEAGDLRFPMKPDMMPNGKTDTNNNCAVSTDYLGANYAYPDASYTEREAIVRDHESYQKGLMWTLANHPRVPESIRSQMATWGLPKDEFTDNGGWPHQIYVREARRMVSDYVVTEHDCRRTRLVDDPVGMGSYNMDSHNVRRFVTADGFVQNEGDVQVSPGGPYLISYRAIVPARGQATNLTVPVCLSSSHIAYGSIRMEPVFMILGQSAATAAVQALERHLAVQDVPFASLRERLLADGQVLDLPEGVRTKPAITKSQLPGVVLDSSDARIEGAWSSSSSVASFVGADYLHDGNLEKGSKSVTWTLIAPESMTCELRISYSAAPNRATNVPVLVIKGDEKTVTTVNQRTAPSVDHLFERVAQVDMIKGDSVSVTVSTSGTDGHVIVDAVQLVEVTP